MARLVTLYSLQWGDLSLKTICEKAKSFGYDGLELGLPNHVDVRRTDAGYYDDIKDTLAVHGLCLKTISTHLVGQAVCDTIDFRHQSILPDYIWGDGCQEGVRERAAEELIRTAHAAKALGVDTVVGFTGSSIWAYLYSFPPVPDAFIEEGYRDFARRFIPILDEYSKLGVRFALEVHPTEIAFDTVTAQRA
ncbi:MAG: sugar phosphate isomerase/epimerase, partial [Tannerellaceae bacterium]|nr:sugar phosphate isomerase/epimerase [Tannerellaceae bacterium]